MKQNTFMSTLALVAIAFLTACGSDELPADPSNCLLTLRSIRTSRLNS